MRLFFMGTPEFALPSLKTLAESTRHSIDLVITRPDRPKGRGLHTEPPPVKQLAMEYGIKVIQPEKVRDNPELTDIFHKIKPEAVIVAAFGRLIPEKLLNIPKMGFINVHASLLPAFRGASPINHALLTGCRTTGISIMKLDAGLDTGPVYKKYPTEIFDEDDAISLSQRLSKIGADVLMETLDLIQAGTILPEPQDDSKSSYAPVLKKEDGIINWEKPAQQIIDQIRGLVPWPCAFTYLEGKALKILKAKTELENHDHLPGTMLKDGKKVLIACSKGYIVPEILQLEGRQALESKAFINGLKIDNIKLGDL